MCPNPPRRGMRVKKWKKRYPYFGALAVPVDLVTWSFRLNEHDPSCRWAAFCRRLTR